MLAQAKEIARRCVEPPLKKKPNEPPFKPAASLLKSIDFLIDCIKRLPSEHCQYCRKICFPEDPKVAFNLHTYIYDIRNTNRF